MQRNADGSFRPKDGISRAEFATMVENLVEKLSNIQ